MMKIRAADISDLNPLSDLFNKYRIFYHQPPDVELAKNFLEERLRNKESVIFVALLGSEATAFCLRTGAKKITLSTSIHNSSARQLYESLGYQRETEFLTYNLVLSQSSKP